MGVYKKDSINSDFDIASQKMPNIVNKLLAVDAKIILAMVPDNDARDMAISHLLQAASMVAYAYAKASIPRAPVPDAK